MSHDIQRLDPAVLIDWLSGVYVAAGRGTDEALAIAGSLTRSSLVGHDSHGIGMTPMYIDHLREGDVFAGRSARIAADHGALVSLDGQHGFGAVIGRQAMAAIERARTHGCAVVVAPWCAWQRCTASDSPHG